MRIYFNKKLGGEQRNNLQMPRILQRKNTPVAEEEEEGEEEEKAEEEE